MKRFNKEGLKSEKGFTMIELIIVIAIMGILAAILVPSFTQMTRKARLKADISTVRQFQTQFELYVADHDGKYPSATDGEATEPADKEKSEKFTEELVAEKYIKASDLEGGVDTGTVVTQSADTSIEWNKAKEHFVLLVPATGTPVGDLADKASDKEKEWIEQ